MGGKDAVVTHTRHTPWQLPLCIRMAQSVLVPSLLTCDKTWAPELAVKILHHPQGLFWALPTAPPNIDLQTSLQCQDAQCSSRYWGGSIHVSMIAFIWKAEALRKGIRTR
eukprot:scaffold16867_cov19-Tisochrysis_lutea.AAC.1